MNETTERLYHLLPSVYRQRDLEGGEPLRALLLLIEGELRLLEGDVAHLYDNWFIETCDEWVVPYIGGLLGVRGLLALRDGTFSQRGRVANALSYRRSKGTAAVLERLAHDVTGWHAVAVEFFERLATTQHLNHVRLDAPATADLYHAGRLDFVGGPFEQVSHLADVRHIDVARGKYNIPNIGLFLWRLQDYPLEGVAARAQPAPQPAHAGRYTFNPLGLDTPLFNVPHTETDLTPAAAETDVPDRLRRRALYDELEARRQALVDGAESHPLYFGDQPALRVVADGSAVPPEQIAICDLSDPPAPAAEGWRRPASTQSYTPTGGGAPRNLPIAVAVDPLLGRIAFPAGVVPGTVAVGYAYGFAGDLGGGPYDRRQSVAGAIAAPVTWQMGVSVDAPDGRPDLVKTVSAAVQAWNTQPAGTSGLIAIMDSWSYEESLTGANAITIPAGSSLTIVAADWPEVAAGGSGPAQRIVGNISPSGVRPHLIGDVEVQGTAPADSTDPGSFVADGLLIEGSVTVRSGNLGAFRLAHSTLVPGTGTGRLSVEAGGGGGQNDALSVTLERTICGPIALADTVSRLSIQDCIVDAGTGTALTAPDTVVQDTTVLGSSDVRTLQASDTIFTETVSVTRRQMGCVRFCYLPIDSLAPRRYRCQPADALTAGQIFPQFTSTRYGHPGYAQLAIGGPAELASGADDEGEMGAFHFLQQPQRIANVRASLDEYLRFGLEAGILFVT